ncbi:hypothetical protein F01_460112 [Burkholderia cenocepacia]|nr:hypothetical protein F01_460112 [Burkholderia cenocepacia]
MHSRRDAGPGNCVAFSRKANEYAPCAACSDCVTLRFMVSLRDIASTRKRTVECSRAIHAGSD